MPKVLTPFEPRLTTMPAEKVAVVTVKGDPNVVTQVAMSARFGAVYALKFQRRKEGGEDFKVTGLRARYPDAHLVPKDQWTIHFALPIPDYVRVLPKKQPEPDVRIETWQYGTVAEVLHLGPYSEEGPTIEKLHKFIETSGCEIAGDHEEEYLTRPAAKVVKTVIRYQVKKIQSE